jgi:hypothetical protein
MDDYGMRNDGSAPKYEGWLGPIKRSDGSVSTEISIGIGINGKEQEIPLMVPGLTKREIDYLIKTDLEDKSFMDKMPKSIMQKAIEHANQRMKSGKSPFKNAEDDK